MNDKNESSDGAVQPILTCTVIPNCLLSADIVLVSSDGHRFGTHCKNLGEFTGGFPVGIAPANGEDVQMPDLDSEALGLFLQYIHHHRQPDLTKVSFKCLSQLAEAIEKYDVYSATEICRIQMSPHVENHCVEVFQYASKHGYRKLMDDAAFIAVQEKYWNKQIFDVCNRQDLLLSAWRRYNEYWNDLFADCYDEPPPLQHPGGTPNCSKWRKFRNVVISQMKRELTIFSKFDEIVEGEKYRLKDCRHCGIRADRWTGRVLRNISIGERMTPFSTFLT